MNAEHGGPMTNSGGEWAIPSEPRASDHGFGDSGAKMALASQERPSSGHLDPKDLRNGQKDLTLGPKKMINMWVFLCLVARFEQLIYSSPLAVQRVAG